MEQREHGFEDRNLVLCCLDLFLAGSETTSKTLQWGLIYLIKNPHIQGGCSDETIVISQRRLKSIDLSFPFNLTDKVQAEIDRVIGQARHPTMADRANLPYSDAVIHEIQRMGNVVPLNGFRMAAKDTTLGGYFIPKVHQLKTHRGSSQTLHTCTEHLKCSLFFLTMCAVITL